MAEYKNPLIVTVTNNNYSKLLEKGESFRDTGDGTYTLNINDIPMYTPEDRKIRDGELIGWQKEIQDKLKNENYDSVVIRYDTNQKPPQHNMDIARNGNHYIYNNLIKAQNLVSIIDRIYKTDHNKQACPIVSLYEWGKEKRAYFINFTKSAFGKTVTQRPKAPSKEEFADVTNGVLTGKINMLEQADAEPLDRLPGESDKDWNKARLEHYQSNENLAIRDSQHPIYLATFKGDFRNRKLLNMIKSDGSYIKPDPNDPEAVRIYNDHIHSDDYAASMINHKTPDDKIDEHDQPTSKQRLAYNSKSRYYENANHLAMVTEPKRGLTNENLDGLWSVEPMNLDPGAIGSELVGCNMAHRMSYKGITISKDGEPLIGDGASVPLMGLVTKDSGVVIPMKNVHGDSVRPQIMTEPRSSMETEMVLNNGKSFTRKEFQARHNYINLPGGPGALELAGFKGKSQGDKGGVMFKDNNGTFVVDANKNENILDVLKSRGYQFPSKVTRLTMAVDNDYAALNNGKPLGYDSLRLIAEMPDKDDASKTRRFALPIDQRLYMKSDHQSLCLTDNAGDVNNLHTEANKTVYHKRDKDGNYHTYVPLTYTDAGGKKHDRYIDAANAANGLKELVNIPENVKKIQAKAGAKYCWSITTSNARFGTDGLNLTSAHAGFNFVEGDKPNYDVLVVEGALKGKIVTELAQKKDKTGKSFQEALSPNGNSLAIVQVPGVQQTGAIEQIKKLNQLGVPIDRVHIAMDTDASENRMVAQGISNAEDMLKHYFPNSQVDVMKWGGNEKGLDDAMVAVLNGKASYDDLNFEYGETKEMYPKWWLTPDKRRSLKLTLGDDYPRVNYETTSKSAYEDMLREDGITKFVYGDKPEPAPNPNKRYNGDDLSKEDQESLDEKNAIFKDAGDDSGEDAGDYF